MFSLPEFPMSMHSFTVFYWAPKIRARIFYWKTSSFFLLTSFFVITSNVYFLSAWEYNPIFFSIIAKEDCNTSNACNTFSSVLSDNWTLNFNIFQKGNRTLSPLQSIKNATVCYYITNNQSVIKHDKINNQ